MRLAIAQPCFGSSSMALRIRKSSVPWTRSIGLPIVSTMTAYNTPAIVDCEGSEAGGWTKEAVSARTATLQRQVRHHGYPACRGGGVLDRRGNPAGRGPKGFDGRWHEQHCGHGGR